jgi:hypothetical protein
MDDGTAESNGIRNGIIEPAHLGDERTALLGFLQRQRELVVWKMKDATDDVLRSTSTPTGLTLHGIMRHLAAVERSWIQCDFADEEELPYTWTESGPDGEPARMGQLMCNYIGESARSDAVIAAAPSLDMVSAKGGFSLRWILLHLIEETARHLGHIDLLREQADGQVGEEPTE